MLLKITSQANLTSTTNDKQKRGKLKGVNFSFDDIVKSVLKKKKKREVMEHFVPLGIELKILENTSLGQGKKALEKVALTTELKKQKPLHNKEAPPENFKNLGNVERSTKHTMETSLFQRNTMTKTSQAISEVTEKALSNTRFSSIDTVTKKAPSKNKEALISSQKEFLASDSFKVNVKDGGKAGKGRLPHIDVVTKKRASSRDFENLISTERNTKDSKETGTLQKGTVTKTSQVISEVTEKASGDTRFSSVDTATKKTPAENKEALNSFQKDFFTPDSFKVNIKAESIVENISSMPRATFQNMLQEIVQKIRLLVSENKSSMEVQLKPEYLGKVKILLLSQEGILTARIVAENIHTANLLNSNLHQVKESLEEQGVKVEYFSVDVESGQEGYKGESNRENYRGFNSHTSRQSKYFGTNQVPQEEEQNPREAGLLNILA